MADFRPLVTIGNYEMPTPSDYVGTETTIVDAARNTSGVMVGAVVRESVAKVELSYKFLPVDKYSEILKLFNTAYGGNFYNDVTFFNQLTNDWTTRKMYVGDRGSSGAFILDDDGRPKGYKDIKISLVEV